jgi:DNA-binding MarR family transcriptional regulator
LTPAGRKIVPVLADLADQNDAEFFGQLTDEQRSGLIALLKDIVREREIRDMPVN